jgi:hypothetical protein
MAGRPRRARRLFFVGVVALLVLAVAFFLAIPSILGRALSLATGRVVELGAARPAWPPPSISFSYLRIRPGLDAAPVFGSGPVEIGIRPLSFLVSSAGLTIELDDLEIELRRTTDGSLEMPGIAPALWQLATAGMGWAGRLQAIVLRGLAIRVPRDSGKDPQRISLREVSLSDPAFVQEEGGARRVSLALDVAGAPGNLETRIESGQERSAVLVGVALEKLDLGTITSDGSWAWQGSLDGRFWYEREWGGDSPAHVMSTDLRLEHAQLVSLTSGLRVKVPSLRLGDGTIDFARHRIDLSGLRMAALDLDLPVDPGGSVDADDSLGVGLPEGWTLALSSLSLSNGRVRLGGRDAGVTLNELTLDEVSSGDLSGRVQLDGSLGEGGRIRLHGQRNGAERGRFTLELANVELAPLLKDLASGVQVSRGRLDASLELEGPPGVAGRGSFAVLDFAAERVGGSQRSPLASWKRLALEMDYFSLVPRRLVPRRGELDSPSFVVTRTHEGFEMLDAFSGADGLGKETMPLALAAAWYLVARAGPTPPPEGGPGEIAIALRDGSIAWTDRSVVPQVTVDLTEASGHALGAQGLRGPIELGFRGRLDAAPLDLEMGITENDVSGTATLARIRLPVFDSYLAPLLGSRFQAGTADVGARFAWQRGMQLALRLGLLDVVLEPTSGTDPVRDSVGVPLGQAISELADPDGRLTLDLALELNPEAEDFGLAEAFPRALGASLQEKLEDRAASDR